MRDARRGHVLPEIEAALSETNKRCEPPARVRRCGASQELDALRAGRLSGPRSAHAQRRCGNAERLIAAYGERIRHCDELGPGSSSTDAIGGATACARSRTSPPRPCAASALGSRPGRPRSRGAPALGPAQRRCQRESGRRCRAASDCAVRIRLRRLDSDPWLLTASNGALDLRSGRVRAGRAERPDQQLEPGRA